MPPAPWRVGDVPVGDIGTRRHTGRAVGGHLRDASLVQVPVRDRRGQRGVLRRWKLRRLQVERGGDARLDQIFEGLARDLFGEQLQHDEVGRRVAERARRLHAELHALGDQLLRCPDALRVRDDRVDRAAGPLEVVGDTRRHRQQLPDRDRPRAAGNCAASSGAYFATVPSSVSLRSRTSCRITVAVYVSVMLPMRSESSTVAFVPPTSAQAVRLGEEALLRIPHADVEARRLGAERRERGLRGVVDPLRVLRGHGFGGGADAERLRRRARGRRRRRHRTRPGRAPPRTRSPPTLALDRIRGTVRGQERRVTPACTPCGTPSSTNTSPFTSVQR